MDSIKQKQVRIPQPGQKEIRKARINKLLNAEMEQAGKIGSMSLEDKKGINTFYNDVLTDIYSIRDKHPLQEIVKGLPGEEGIDASLHELGPRKKALTENYRDKKGLTSKRILWKDGTVQNCKKIDENHRTSIVKNPDGTTESQEYYNKSGSPASTEIPRDIEDSICNLMEVPQKSLTSGEKKTSPDMSDLEKKLDKNLSETQKVREKRTLWKPEGIKRKETLYENGLKETITKWEKNDIKQREIADANRSFCFSKTLTPGKTFTSLDYKNESLEKNINHDNGTALWRYRGRDHYLEQCSLRSEEGKKIDCTLLEDKRGMRKISAASEEGVKSIKLEDLYNNKKVRLDTFSDGALQCRSSSPGMDRVTAVTEKGVGMDMKTTGEGETRLGWLPDKEVMAYSKKLPDGTTNKCHFYNNSSVTQQVSYPDGNSYKLIELPNKILQKTYNYNTGDSEALTWFEQGEQRRTVKYKDNTFLSDTIYGGNMQKQGIKFSDGTCYLYKNWGNGISQQCFCWPHAGLGHLTSRFEKDGISDKRLIFPDGSYRKETLWGDRKSEMAFSGDPAVKNIYDGPLRDIISSPVLAVKFLENPFHNPLLTLDLQLWVHFLLAGAREGTDLIKAAEKVRKIKNAKSANPDLPVYLKVSFNLSSEKGE